MARAHEWASGLVMLMLGFSTAAVSAQATPGAAVVARQARLSLEGSAGLQAGYAGSMQSVAFGFAPTRSLTLLVSAHRSFIPSTIHRYENGYSAERGGTEQFVSAEVRYAFLPHTRVSPYVVGGTGRGISRLNVNEFFPHPTRRHIQVLYYGGGVRIPVRSRLDAFVDTRFVVSSEAKSDYFGVTLPIRAGVAFRF
jgi:hypothetical protein